MKKHSGRSPLGSLWVMSLECKLQKLIQTAQAESSSTDWFM